MIFYIALQATIISVAFSMAGLIISQSLQQWSNTPTITTLATISAHVSEIQFPTITICPETGSLPNNWGYIKILLDRLQYNCAQQPKASWLNWEPGQPRPHHLSPAGSGTCYDEFFIIL